MWSAVSHFLFFTLGTIAGVTLMCLLQAGRQADEQFTKFFDKEGRFGRMKLVVAEKPSVAQSLATVLGAKEKKDGDLEGGGWLVSWYVGHLVELAQPEAYGEQYAKWRYADLPILPAHWKYDVAKDKKKQLGVLAV